MAISLARFIVYNMDYDVSDADGSKSTLSTCYYVIFPSFDSYSNIRTDAWCTAEMCTAIIVVSLPSLKSLIGRTTPVNTTNRSNTGYLQAGSGKIPGSSRPTYSSHIQGGTIDDEEMELTFLDRKPSPTPTGTTDETGAAQSGKDSVIVTTNFTVTRDAL
jgi:hypothetical protein